MRGLGPHDRVCELRNGAALERRASPSRAAHSCTAGRFSRAVTPLALSSPSRCPASSRPTAAATIVRRFAAPLECVPALMETAGASVGLSTDRGWLSLPPPRRHRALSQRPPLLPGRLDRQPARVGVAGLGDPAEAAPLAARVLARGQTEKRAPGSAAGNASNRRARPSTRARSASRPHADSKAGRRSRRTAARPRARRSPGRASRCSGRLSKRCRRNQASWASVHALPS